MRYLIYDILFCLTMAIQELNDTSFSHTIIMKTRFTDQAIIIGGTLAHTASSLGLVTVCWLVFRFYSL